MLSRLRKLVWKIVFRLAFGGFIVIEFVVWILLFLGFSNLFSGDSFVVEGILVSLFFLGLFAIGALSYFIFQRMTHAQYVLSESEKCRLRRGEDYRRIKRRKILYRWAPWLPTLSVVLICIFMDYMLPVVSHLLHPGSGRMIEYEVSIPFTWTITSSGFQRSDNNFSIVVAERYRGLIKSSYALYFGARPPFSVSNMSFRNIPDGDEFATRPRSSVISAKVVRFANDDMKCWEEVPPRWMTSGRYIDCSTPTGNFSAGFSGSDEDVAEFYRVLSAAKRKN